MNVAITIWENRISPVFDAAEKLLIAEIREGAIAGRNILPLRAGSCDRLLPLLKDHQVKVLICGALCMGTAFRLETYGIHVISFITGDAVEVLASYARKEDLSPFFMPGCQWRRCQVKAEGEGPGGQLDSSS